MKEKLSAMADGELNEREVQDVLHVVSDDLELSATWERYHVIRAAIRRELDVIAGSGLVRHVREQIRNEPTVLAPGEIAVTRRRYLVRLVAGVAVAASVAAVAIVGLRVLDGQEAAKQPQLMASTVEQDDYLRTSSTRWQTVEPEVERDLNMYLIEHNEFTPTSRMHGMMSYVRIAGYDSE